MNKNEENNSVNNNEKFIKDKDRITEDALANIYSYLEVTQTYINEHESSNQIRHLELLIYKIQEEVFRMTPYYEVLTSFSQPD